MNEQAIQDSYDLFVSQGYTKSLEEYKKLLATNPNALKDSYDAFVSDGYTKTIDDYKTLMGVGGQPVASKKKFFRYQTRLERTKKLLRVRLWKMVHRLLLLLKEQHHFLVLR